jgi:hypothetical protein
MPLESRDAAIARVFGEALRQAREDELSNARECMAMLGQLHDAAVEWRDSMRALAAAFAEPLVPPNSSR